MLHYRTAELLRVTAQPGDEKLLLAMVEEDLPGWATWSVLEGLGATGTEAAQTYLLERAGGEKDAGLFMATARGLGHLGERRAVPAITERLLAFADGWRGVENHLGIVLGMIGGPEARENLERYAADERARHAEMARRVLERMP